MFFYPQVISITFILCHALPHHLLCHFILGYCGESAMDKALEFLQKLASDARNGKIPKKQIMFWFSLEASYKKRRPYSVPAKGKASTAGFCSVSSKYRIWGNTFSV
jgi:hypothetical protein